MLKVLCKLCPVVRSEDDGGGRGGGVVVCMSVCGIRIWCLCHRCEESSRRDDRKRKCDE